MSTALRSLQASFREVMAAAVAPVAVVTSMDGTRPAGATVSAFASLSMDPPLVLVSLARNSDTLEAIRRSRKFGVNVLSSDQAELASRFSSKLGPEKFDTTQWDLDHQLPRIRDCQGWLAGDVTNLVEAGDHVVAFGFVVAAEPTGRAPLAYQARSFATATPVVQ